MVSKGVYRSDCLTGTNVFYNISTSEAQAETEEFREKFGLPAQSTLPYQWARSISLFHANRRYNSCLTC